MRGKHLGTLTVGALLLAPLAACSDPGGPPSPTPNGAVRAIAFLDLNGDGRIDSGEPGAAGITVSLALAAGGTSHWKATTGGDGSALLLDIPPARYRLLVDSASVGDTLRLLSVDSSTFTVRAADTTTIVAAISFPRLSIQEARETRSGRKLFIEGIALTGQSAFGDGSMHVMDATGAIRAIRVAAGPAQPGDSVRILAVRSEQSGQPVLSDALVFLLKRGVLPAPVKVTTAEAATAKGGTLDAAYVTAEATTLLDVRQTPGGSVVLTVDDGSGPAEINLGNGQGSALLVGAKVDVAGVLVPTDNVPGRWQIRPFREVDLKIHFDSATIADARRQSPGRTVQVAGVALTGWATFADGTLHLQDATGAIRAVQVGQANVFAGDSIALVGTVAIVNGQPVLTGGRVTVRKQNVGLPAPKVVTTAVAKTADGGELDAAAVRVAGVIKDTLSAPSGQFLMSVDDGTGPVEVLIEPTTGLRRPTLVPGASVDVGGVLVPVTTGAYWQIKPRTPTDLIVR
ncbi:MAG: hypothetical protein IRZ00_08730 [Gemmatimonadetes bacterium]|nr:hypothetical protein [Gemmatimonadota bacterium]